MILQLAVILLVNFLIGEESSNMNETKTRKEIEVKYKWNKENMYSSYGLWEKDLQDLKNSPSLKQLASYQDQLGKNAQNLKKALELYFNISRKLEHLMVFSHIWKDEDMSNDQANIADSKVEMFAHDFSVRFAWLEPEILQIPEENMRKYLKDPVLKEYAFYLENVLRWKKHSLPIPQEELLARVQEPLDAPHKTFSAFNGIDVVFQPVKNSAGKDLPLTHGSYYVYIKTSDRVLRENAFENLHAGFEKMENTLANLLAGHVKKHMFYAKARHFQSALQNALFRNNIATEVYTNLLATVKANSKTLDRFISLKKRALNLKEFHVYDLYAPIITDVEFKMDVEEAKKTVLKAVASLGPEYQKELEKGFNQQRWVDFLENKNKRPGAYSTGCYDSYPYMLLNFHGSLNDVSTLAHEAGHSMQTFLANSNQPYCYASYSIFIAEIASTFNEQLLFEYLLQNTKDKKTKAFLISFLLDNMQATFFRQTLFADFELKIHQAAEKGIPLTLKFFKDTYKNLYREYYGPQLVIDDKVAIEWARIPHFYSDFYVYQYSTGVAAAAAYFEAVKNKKHCQEYLTFLKSGSSFYPLDLLRRTGVDLTAKEPIEAFVKRFNELMDQLEELLVELDMQNKPAAS